MIRYFLSAESVLGNSRSKVIMRFPLWEGFLDSGIPSPDKTSWYLGLIWHDKQIRERKLNADNAQNKNTMIIKCYSRWLCWTFLPVIREFFIPIVAKCLLTGDHIIVGVVDCCCTLALHKCKNNQTRKKQFFKTVTESTYWTMSLIRIESSLPSSVCTSTEKPVKACDQGNQLTALKKPFCMANNQSMTWLTISRVIFAL